MIAGPQFSNYMAQVAPAYGTDPFPEPPSDMLYAPAPVAPPRNTTPTSRSTEPATEPSADPTPAPTKSSGKK